MTMTMWLDIHTNADGSPDGYATIKATNPMAAKVDADGNGIYAEIGDTLDHIAHWLGQSLERVKEAKANADQDE